MAKLLNLNAVKHHLEKSFDQGTNLLGFVKDKISEVAKTTSLRQVLEEEPTYQAQNGEQLVRYFVQGGHPEVPDDEDNLFTLPPLPYYTKAVVMQDFPLRGYFHFRFKMPDDEFGFVWVDVPDLEDLVPCYEGMIQLKVLCLPVPNTDYGRLWSIARPESTKKFSPSRRAPQMAVESSAPVRKPVANPDLLVGESPAQGSSAGSLRQAASRRSDDFDFFATSGGAGGFGTASGNSSNSSMLSQQSAPPAPLVRAEELNRDQLVKEREQEKQARIQEKLTKHSEAREKEQSGKQERAEAGQELKLEMDNWALNSQDQSYRDIRTLLASLQDVIWEGSTWHPVSLGDLMLNPAKVKKCWQKGILISHPDRHNDADGRRRYRAERIFEAINESYKKFKP